MECIITVKEARKILGKQSESLSDDQMIEIVDTLEMLAQYEINVIGSKK